MPIKILTIDDSKTIRLIVAKAFRSYDCQIIEAANGVEGLDAAAREKPDIIILDVTMPVMDGYETLGKLKADANLKNIPVIMLTAEAGRDNVLRIAKLGVRDYLIKPFKEEIIIERVGRVVTLQSKDDGKGAAGGPAKLLVVDDKPAIIDQIRAKLDDGKWVVEGCNTPAQAMEYCQQNRPDAALVSLSLPDQGGFTLFQMLRAHPKTKNLPVFAVSVKTAADEQTRAQQAGFNGNITKPIDFDQLKARLASTASTDPSPSFFAQRDGALVISLPAGFSEAIANEISVTLRGKIEEAVDAGLDASILDVSQLNAATVQLVRLCVTAVGLCQELSLRHVIVCSEALGRDFKQFEESKDWNCVASYADAVTALKGSAVAA
jgi:two-component system cell cycle response regulator